MKDLFLISAATFVVILTSVRFGVAQAATQETVSATVKLSVCGDGTIEGEEECEGSNLNGEGCESLRYGAGTLTCDSGCEFDVSTCGPSPTPSATPSISPTPTASSDSSDSSLSSPGQPDASQQTLAPLFQVPVSFNLIETLLSQVPEEVVFFDRDKDGVLSLGELGEIVAVWISEWKKRPVSERNCDVNSDEMCNLVDLSVLLYYVE